MVRRLTILFVFLLCCASSAWPKWKEDELKQLDDKLQPILDQLQTMQNQIQALNKQLEEMRQNQTQFQTVILRQQRKLDEIDQLVSSMRLGDEEHYSTLKRGLESLRTDTQASFKQLGAAGGGGATIAGGGGTPAGGGVAPTPAPPKPTVVHYVVDVKGTDVLVDLTSADGVQQGTKLALYKGTDPNTRVGVLEITKVTDSGSHARILTLNAGVKADFSDIVRMEQ